MYMPRTGAFSGYINTKPDAAKPSSLTHFHTMFFSWMDHKYYETVEERFVGLLSNMIICMHIFDCLISFLYVTIEALTKALTAWTLARVYNLRSWLHVRNKICIQ
jgi:hypothetical protein